MHGPTKHIVQVFNTIGAYFIHIVHIMRFMDKKTLKYLPLRTLYVHIVPQSGRNDGKTS